MDAATGLVYAQQRYYDPLVGKFLSIDPVAADPNTGGNFNRYWYANDNPYRFTDPDGRESPSFQKTPLPPPDAATINAAIGLAADFTPIVGDIKGAVEAFNDPTAANIVAAVVGIVPGAGDIAGKLIKNAAKLGDLRAIHKADSLGSAPEITGLPDGELLQSVINPKNGDFVTVNSKTGGVVDGNTRVTELQRRAADPDSNISPDTQIPVETHTPDDSMFNDGR